MATVLSSNKDGDKANSNEVKIKRELTENTIPEAPTLEGSVPDAPQLDIPEAPGDAPIYAPSADFLKRTLTYAKLTLKSKEDLEQEQKDYSEKIKKCRLEMEPLKKELDQTEELLAAAKLNLASEGRDLKDTGTELTLARSSNKPIDHISNIEKRVKKSKEKIEALEKQIQTLTLFLNDLKKKYEEIKKQEASFRESLVKINKQLNHRKDRIANEEDAESMKYRSLVEAYPHASVDELELLFINKFNKNILSNFMEDKGDLFYSLEEILKIKDALLPNASNIAPSEARSQLQQMFNFALGKGSTRTALGDKPREKLKQILGHDVVESFVKKTGKTVNTKALEKAKHEFVPRSFPAGKKSNSTPSKDSEMSIMDAMRQRVAQMRPNLESEIRSGSESDDDFDPTQHKPLFSTPVKTPQKPVTTPLKPVIVTPSKPVAVVSQPMLTTPGAPGKSVVTPTKTVTFTLNNPAVITKPAVINPSKPEIVKPVLTTPVKPAVLSSSATPTKPVVNGTERKAEQEVVKVPATTEAQKKRNTDKEPLVIFSITPPMSPIKVTPVSSLIPISVSPTRAEQFQAELDNLAVALAKWGIGRDSDRYINDSSDIFGRYAFETTTYDYHTAVDHYKKASPDQRNGMIKFVIDNLNLNVPRLR